MRSTITDGPSSVRYADTGVGSKGVIFRQGEVVDFERMSSHEDDDSGPNSRQWIQYAVALTLVSGEVVALTRVGAKVVALIFISPSGVLTVVSRR